MTTLAIITALHGRYRLARLFLDYYRKLEVPGIELLLSCAISDSDDEMDAIVRDEFPGWHPVYAPNMPLPAKFAANMENVKAWKPDAMMILGCDDFVNSAYIQRGMELLDNAEWIAGNEVAYLKAGTDQVIIQRSTSPIGAGRILSGELLSLFDWNPWKDDYGRLDAAMRHKLEERGIQAKLITDYARHGCALLDVKTDENRRSWARVQSSSSFRIDGRSYIEKHFPTIAEDLLTW